MIKKLLPVILLIVGAGAGIGAGLVLRPEPVPLTEEEAAAKAEEEKAKKEEEAEGILPETEFLKMSNQFVIPVVKNNAIASLVVMSLSVEVPAGQKPAVYEREPKLRDSFLQELFNHANRGGFDGAFTSSENMKAMRMALLEVGHRDIGEDLILDVLIQEIARQDY